MPANAILAENNVRREITTRVRKTKASPRPRQLLKCYPSQMVKPQKRYAMIRHLGAWH